MLKYLFILGSKKIGLTLRSVSQREVWLRTVLVRTESLTIILQISSRNENEYLRKTILDCLSEAPAKVR